MGVEFTPSENSALYALLAENTTDIILKTDLKGFILHASPAIEGLGTRPSDGVGSPHLLDLVHPSHIDAISAAHEAVVSGGREQVSLEFPAITADAGQKWFSIQMRRLVDERGETYGALGIMQSIEQRRTLEEKLFAAEMTDSLTGLTNRKAFISMLEHLVAERAGGCVAIFAIDYFKALNMRYGQSFGDEVLVVFTGILRSLLRAQDIVSRIGGERVCVLLPGSTAAQSEAVCQRVILTLTEIHKAAGENGIPITASVGVARIGKSVDATLKKAELALFLAKAKGRNRLEMARGRGFPIG